MEWLNLHTSTLDSPQFVGAEPEERATWLCLLRYCVGQENGGRITLCRDWTDRRWQQLCRVTKREVAGPSELWAWDGDDLTVWAYPVQKEMEVRKNRLHGSLGGRPSGSSQKKQPDKPTDNPTETTRSTTGLSSGYGLAETERKGKEGKGIGKEEEGNGNPPADQAAGSRATASRPEAQAEAEAYFLEIGSTSLEAETFFDHYQANGWRQGGKTALKDWRAAARNWVRRNGSATRGAAAGLGGDATGKNLLRGGARGVVSQSPEEPRMVLPVAGLDEAMAEVAAGAEQGGAQ
jgi:hypothetical protein